VRFGFFLREAFGSIRRNWVMSMAAVITVFISTAILGAVLVTDHNLDRGATSLKNRVTIEVFIKDDAGPEGTQALQDKIAAMPEVKTFVYISKEEALKRFRERYGDRIVQNLPLNPLPASFEIQVHDADTVDEVAQRFFDDPNVDNDPGTTNGVQYAQATVRKMLGTINLVEKVMWGVTGVFGLAAVMLISTTVRLSIFARRREIEIMRLVGATNGFVRLPFLIEGTIKGMLGGVLAVGLAYLAHTAVSRMLFETVFFTPTQVGLGIAAGAALGFLGSLLSVGRHLRAVWRDA
jgi:cell division transport system permease protein